MKPLLLTLLTGLLMLSCSDKKQSAADNPFFAEWTTPYGVPPFDQIKDSHFEPAFTEGMTRQLAEMDSIASNPEAPTFENTIVKMEKSGKLLTKVGGVFFNLTSANTNDTLQAIQARISPKLSAHQDNIYLNADLFARVKTLFDQKETLNLTGEQKKLLSDTYKYFVRGGANLNDEQKAKLRKINEELSSLYVKFGDNVLKDNNAFQLVLDKPEDLAGLPENVKTAGAEAAKAKKMEGKWIYTLHKPSWIPFATYSTRRDLREKIVTAYTMRGDNGNESDNNEVISKIVKLRLEKANVMGFPTYAHFILDDRMAKTPENVNGLLMKVWPPAIAQAKRERDDIQKMIDKEGGNFKAAHWDWLYYSEKIRKEKYDLDEEEIRPYLQADNVIKGTFILAQKLFGITFEEKTDIPKYFPEVRTFVVKNAEGKEIGIYLSDWFYRDSKRGGAWMNNYRSQSNMDGNRILPIIVNVGNFSKPQGDTPSLLNLDEASTLFHEFGHALHGLLSDVTYPSISGTATPSDFVEFPSQVLENWLLEPEMLKLYAFHYKTGEVMPEKLIEKIRKAGKFNQGFATTEYVAAALLDMGYHSLTNADNLDVKSFEKKTLEGIGLIPEVVSRYRSTYFSHIFSGDGYSAGYYSYLWSEVMDADAFDAFREKGIFDAATAKSYHDNILSKGGTIEAGQMYRNFRGRDPEIGPLLKKRGLN